MAGPIPEPCPLARYRQLAPSASIKVSPLCLGTMNFGNGWYVPSPLMLFQVEYIYLAFRRGFGANPFGRKEKLGECGKETTFQILDKFYENGGSFIDTYGNLKAPA